MANKKAGTHKEGRSARTGKFIPVKQAKKHPSTTEVETIPNRKTGKKR